MNICKSCSNEFEGKYCNACGQEYIEKQTLKTFFKVFLEAVNINNKVFLTLKGLFLKPRKIVNEFHEGNTNKYLGPFTTLFIAVGISYILSESNILGFNIADPENEFTRLISILRPLLLTSLIVGLLPFTAYGWIRTTIITIYSFSGLLIILLLDNILFRYMWILHISDVSISIWVLTAVVLVYLLYFFISSYIGHYRSLIIYLFVFVLVLMLDNHITTEKIKNDDALKLVYSQTNPPPHWSYAEFQPTWYSSNILSDSSYFDIDINEDGIRDITLFLRDSLDNNFMLIADIRYNKAINLNLNDLLTVGRSKKITDVSIGSVGDEKFNIIYDDGSTYGILFNGIHFYGAKNSRKSNNK